MRGSTRHGPAAEALPERMVVLVFGMRLVYRQEGLRHRQQQLKRLAEAGPSPAAVRTSLVRFALAAAAPSIRTMPSQVLCGVMLMIGLMGIIYRAEKRLL